MKVKMRSTTGYLINWMFIRFWLDHVVDISIPENESQSKPGTKTAYPEPCFKN